MENKQDDLKKTEKIIECAYEQLKTKISARGICEQDIKALQIELESMLRDLEGHEFRPKDKSSLDFENNGPQVDVLIHYNSITVAIKLKVFTEKNRRRPRNRYDVFKNLLKLENYKENDSHLCYFMLVTDDTHYVNPEKPYSSKKTGDFDFRDGVKYKANTRLVYIPKNSCDLPYFPPIFLKQSYDFKWDKINQLNFLKVKV